MDTGTKFIFYF